MSLAVGLDFGTTNSSLAASTDSGVTLLRFAGPGTLTPPRSLDVFRSVLYFDPDELGPDRRPLAVTGPQAIESYLEAEGQGRLLQSVKSYLASRLFKSTSIFGRSYSLEDLIGLIVRDLRQALVAQLGELPARLVVGRPVRFAGGARDDGDGTEAAEPRDRENAAPGDAASDKNNPENNNETYALSRLRRAIALGGFPEVVFEYEPVAAAYHYEGRLSRDELVLIADFGGGTSDFCLMRVGPGVRRRGRQREDLLGTEGVALAGDALDSRIVRHVVAPLLGRGTHYVTGGKRMPVPPWLFSRLSRWHHLSFLRSRETLKLLDDIHGGAEEPARIAALLHVIDHDLGYRLYQAVEQVKIQLSQQERARLVFHDGPVRMDEEVRRADFEGWIAPETTAIDEAVGRLLARTGIAAEQVDAVFMTGGTSLVPAVQRIFAGRFGADRLRGGGELTSVASGLALRARDLP